MLLDDFSILLQETRGIKAITINTYIRHVVPILKYGVELGYIKDFKYRQLREETEIKEIHSDDELKILLTKPTMDSFAEYRNWVIINFLLGTGVRANELRHLRIKNVNMENNMIILERTKTKKQRFIPISSTLYKVLREYLQYRGSANEEEFLFCNVYGEQLPRTTLQMGITKYAKKRGVNKYSLHLFRYTFATRWIMNNGNPFQLQRILGHTTMKMVNNYINMEGEDLKNNIDMYNPLDQVNHGNIKKYKQLQN